MNKNKLEKYKKIGKEIKDDLIFLLLGEPKYDVLCTLAILLLVLWIIVLLSEVISIILVIMIMICIIGIITDK